MFLGSRILVSNLVEFGVLDILNPALVDVEGEDHDRNGDEDHQPDRWVLEDGAVGALESV